jgi:hypothetical protein
VYILVVEAIERRKTGVEYAEVNGITLLLHTVPTPTRPSPHARPSVYQSTLSQPLIPMCHARVIPRSHASCLVLRSLATDGHILIREPFRRPIAITTYRPHSYTINTIPSSHLQFLHRSPIAVARASALVIVSRSSQAFVSCSGRPWQPNNLLLTAAGLRLQSRFRQLSLLSNRTRQITRASNAHSL